MLARVRSVSSTYHLHTRYMFACLAYVWSAWFPMFSCGMCVMCTTCHIMFIGMDLCDPARMYNIRFYRGEYRLAYRDRDLSKVCTICTYHGWLLWANTGRTCVVGCWNDVCCELDKYVHPIFCSQRRCLSANGCTQSSGLYHFIGVVDGMYANALKFGRPPWSMCTDFWY